MKRTPIVITATVAGLAGVPAFHTTPARLRPRARPGAAAASPAPTTTGPSGSGQGRSVGGSSSPPRPRSAARAKPGGTRTVDGPAVNYNFGVLSVSVTVSAHKITRVGIASLDDGGMSRSQSIDQHAIPLLEHEAMQAHSANIQGASGANYTNTGLEQDLPAT